MPGRRVADMSVIEDSASRSSWPDDSASHRHRFFVPISPCPSTQLYPNVDRRQLPSCVDDRKERTWPAFFLHIMCAALVPISTWGYRRPAPRSTSRYISRTLEMSPTAEPDGSNILTKETLLAMKALEALVVEHVSDLSDNRHPSSHMTSVSHKHPRALPGYTRGQSDLLTDSRYRRSGTRVQFSLGQSDLLTDSRYRHSGTRVQFSFRFVSFRFFSFLFLSFSVQTLGPVQKSLIQ